MFREKKLTKKKLFSGLNQRELINPWKPDSNELQIGSQKQISHNSSIGESNGGCKSNDTINTTNSDSEQQQQAGQPIEQQSNHLNSDKLTNLLNSIVMGGRRDDSSSNPDDEKCLEHHSLYGNGGVCSWPGCEKFFDDVHIFTKHLNSVHRVNDKSTADLRVQKNVVSQLEVQLRKEKDILQAMLYHLDKSNQLSLSLEAKNENKNLLAQSALPFIQNSPTVQITNSISSGPIRSPLLNSPNVVPIRRRITDKSIALAGGEFHFISFLKFVHGGIDGVTKK